MNKQNTKVRNRLFHQIVFQDDVYRSYLSYQVYCCVRISVKLKRRDEFIGPFSSQNEGCLKISTSSCTFGTLFS